MASEEVTRYLKRLRKGYGAGLRYLVCFERHKSGAWHTHALLHTRGKVLTTRAAREPWTAGFSNARVADLRAAGYVTKYVTKDLVDESTERVPRIRASRDPRYGGAVMCHEDELIDLLQQRRDPTTGEVWAANLRMLHQHLAATERGSVRVWQEITRAQEGPTRVLLEGGRQVDPETGELLLPTTRTRR